MVYIFYLIRLDWVIVTFVILLLIKKKKSLYWY